VTQRAPAALAAAMIAALLASTPPSLAGDPPVEPLAISRETTWITEPLRPDGTPDYAAWITRRYGVGVTSLNNAAPGLMAIRMIDRVGGAATPERELFAEQHRRALRGPWREVDAPLVAGWLGVNEANLERVEQIVGSRTRFWIAPPGDMAMDAPIPSHLGFRGIANALRARTLRRAAAEDGDGARRDLILGLRVAALVDQGPWLIDRLIGVFVRSIAAEPVVALANPPPAYRVAAAMLLGGLREVPPSSPLDDVLDVSERLQFLAGYVDLYRAARRSPEAWQERSSTVLGMYDDAVNAALGRKPLLPNLRRIPGWAIDWNELFRRINECWLAPGCDAGFAAAAQDLESPAFDRLLDQARTEPGARRRIARAFLTLQTPAGLGNARVSWNEQEAIARAGLVSAAAALWHVDHGRYPESAAALASGPASAGFDPASDHAGYAFRYAVSSDGRRFAYTATLLQPGEAGRRMFCADSSGRLASTTDGAVSMVVDGLCAPGTTTLVARTAQLDAAAQYDLGMKYATGKGVPKDAAKAAEWFQKAAAQGHAAAQSNLGWMYASGDGVRKDAAKAVEWSQKAAAQGHADAQYMLGMMYGAGDGVPKDAAKAVEWYRKAAAQGYARAQFNLGLMYANGEGVPRDAAKAVEWYQKAAAQGDGDAQIDLGGMYATGDGVPKDAAKAVEWYQKGAGQGYARAQFNLGLMYESGEGVPRDAAKAVEWFQKAAAQGYADGQSNLAAQGDGDAQLMLGVMYATGNGVPKDAAKAVEWYQKAAAQGYARAQFNLAMMYESGEGVPKDHVLAYAWTNLAPDYEPAAMLRDTLEHLLTAEERAEAQRLSSRWKKGTVLAR
jgi:TPR repeat protein